MLRAAAGWQYVESEHVPARSSDTCKLLSEMPQSDARSWPNIEAKLAKCHGSLINYFPTKHPCMDRNRLRSFAPSVQVREGNGGAAKVSCNMCVQVKEPFKLHYTCNKSSVRTIIGVVM